MSQIETKTLQTPIEPNRAQILIKGAMTPSPVKETKKILSSEAGNYTSHLQPIICKQCLA